MTTILELGPGTVPPALPAAWTRVDVANPVRRWSGLHRGRASLSELVPAQGSITVDNRSGDLDPDNPAGPYAGQLVVGTPIRLREDDVVRFSGYAAAWHPGVSYGDATVEIEVTDLLGWLATWRPAESAVHRVIRGLRPFAWWPCDSARGTFADERVAGRVASYLASAKPGGEPILPFGDTPSMVGTMTGGTGGGARRADATAMPRPPWTILGFFKFGGTVNNTIIFDVRGSDLLTGATYIGTNSTPALVGNIAASGASQRTVVGPSINDGRVYLLALRYALNGTLRLSLRAFDGGLSTYTVTGGYIDPMAYGSVFFGLNNSAATTDGATVAVNHAATFARELTDAELNSIGDAAYLAHAGESVTARLNRLADMVGIPAALRSFAAGTEPVVGWRTDRDVTEQLRSLAVYRRGPFHVSAAGQLVSRLAVAHEPVAHHTLWHTEHPAPLADTFDRADAPALGVPDIGGPWVATNVGITASEAHGTVNAAENYALAPNAADTAVAVTARTGAGAAPYSVAAVLRAAGVGDHLVAQATGATLTLAKRVGGVRTELVSVPIPALVANTTYHLRVQAFGDQVQVWFIGRLRITHALSPADLAALVGTMAGL